MVLEQCSAALGTVRWPLFGTILLRRSGKTWSASFKVIAIVFLKKPSCKDKAQKLLETGNVTFQDSNYHMQFIIKIVCRRFE